MRRDQAGAHQEHETGWGSTRSTERRLRRLGHANHQQDFCPSGGNLTIRREFRYGQAVINNDTGAEWWRSAVVYQIYPRSFADADGDGIGDLPGITSRVGYLADLGVDAVWLSPFYPSPLADGGYDVADHRDVDARLGTLADFDALVAALHGRGVKMIIDVVPNHTSEDHPWFRAALAARRPRPNETGICSGTASGRTASSPQRLAVRVRRAGVAFGWRWSS